MAKEQEEMFSEPIYLDRPAVHMTDKGKKQAVSGEASGSRRRAGYSAGNKQKEEPDKFSLKHDINTSVQQARTRTPLIGREDINRRIMAGAHTWRDVDLHQPRRLSFQSGHWRWRGVRRVGAGGRRCSGRRRQSVDDPR